MTRHSCDVCIHTNDKKYTQTPEIAESKFSSVNIGRHKLKTNTDALNDKVWDSRETVFWQLDSEYDFLTKNQQIGLIKAAFLETSLLTPLRIQQKRRQTGDAHIKINWLGAKDEKFFKERASVLAFAYGPQVGIGGDITMNSDHLWLLRKEKLTMQEAFDKGYIDESKFDKAHPNNTVKFYDPRHTMKHEGGGHACGMRHLNNSALQKTAIMYPFYNGQRVFSNEDKEYLFSLYGKSNIAHRISSFIQHRMGRF
jgi:hypothetical protein